MTEEEIKKILDKAILAPSMLNTQPWVFKWNGEALDVLIHRSRSALFCDPAQQNLYLSIGAVVENIALTADFLGYRTQVAYCPDPTDPEFAAKIEFEKKSHGEGYDVLYDFIEQRVTNRGPYFDRPVPPVAQQALTESFTFNDHFELIFRNDESLKQVVLISDKMRSINAYLITEYAKIVKSWQSQTFRRQKTFFLDLYAKIWLFLNRFFPIFFIPYYRFRRYFVEAGNLGWFVADDKSPASLLRAGRAMQRILLNAARYGLDTHLINFSLMYLDEMALKLSEEEWTQAEKIRQIIKTEFAGKRSHPIFVFRLGYARKKERQVSRQPLENFLMLPLDQSKSRNVQVSEEPEITSFEPAISVDRQEILEILKVGGRAVSPYNIQPWRFAIEKNRVLVFIKKVMYGLLDFEYLDAYSLGALLENLREGARHYHYSFSYTPISETLNERQPHTILTFYKKREPGPEYPIDHVLMRYTNRKMYLSRPIPSNVPEEMKRIYNSTTASVINISGHEDFIRAYSDVEKIRACNLSTSNEIYDYLIFDAKQADSQKNHLDIRTLDIPFSDEMAMRLTRRYRGLREILRRTGISGKKMAEYQTGLLLSAPLVVAFTETSVRRPTLAEDWMKIQRIINLLQKYGLSSQIITSSIDVLRLNKAAYNKRELAMVDSLTQRIESLLHHKIDNLVTVLRVGYAAPCRVTSQRMDIESLLIPSVTHV